MSTSVSAVMVRITKGGRIILPAEFRRAARLKIGQQAMLQLVDGSLVLANPRQVIRRAQKLVRQSIPNNVSLVEQLISEPQMWSGKIDDLGHLIFGNFPSGERPASGAAKLG